jgi:hypothetical protein
MQERLQIVFGLERRLRESEGRQKQEIAACNSAMDKLKSHLRSEYTQKVDAFRLCFNMQLDCCEKLFDPKSHKVGETINAANPKLPPEVQCLSNMYSWQQKVQAQQLNDRDHLNAWFSELE